MMYLPNGAKVMSFAYRYLVRPVLFRLDPERVHDKTIRLATLVGKCQVLSRLLQAFCGYQSPLLHQKILGISFANPIGLAGGFDKNGELTRFLPAIGFGFAEVGSITAKPCVGNKRPRLWRLSKSKSLVVYYGLKNDGVKIIARRLIAEQNTIPLGTNIAKTNSAMTCGMRAGAEDYLASFRALNNVGDYFTINISCPNAYGGLPFTEPKSLEYLLSKLDKAETDKPIFIKLPPDLDDNQLDKIIRVAVRHRVHGFICSNLTKNRQNRSIRDAGVPAQGGLSGKVVEELADELIAKVYRQTKGRYVIIGCGGVFTAADAYKKIRLGASLVQLITGMIYMGPQAIGQINHGLTKLLMRDGFASISEAIGVDSK